jgi:hypothetical protein
MALEVIGPHWAWLPLAFDRHRSWENGLILDDAAKIGQKIHPDSPSSSRSQIAPTLFLRSDGRR